MKHWKLAVALVCLGSTAALAQVSAPQPSTIQDLAVWVQTQQAQVGVSYDLHKTKAVATWWDAVSIGQSGINVGSASALDFLDLGPSMAAANGVRTRYGACVPIHIGNIWNSSTGHLSKAVADHVHLATVPNLTLAPMFMVPDGRAIKKWNWTQDFQVALAYRFGGTAAAIK